MPLSDTIIPVARLDRRRQFLGHATARNRGVGDRREAFPRDVIDYVQHPEPPPAGELVMHEVQ